MAKNNTARFEVVLDAKGLVTGVKQVDALGASVNKLTGASTVADKASKSFYNTQEKGVIGTANGTKSFAKMAETINSGGSSSLVAAYATLAANIFAVTAAFNAMRSAAQVQALVQGLDLLGDRSGRTLSLISDNLQDITKNTISVEQAMRSTAIILSGGFGAQHVEALGKAAFDASIGLGRNLSDSMDRLTRGVIKIEPELLDELGLMTRLEEAASDYAITLNKTASSLTQTERRMAFFNAVVEEAELKFGGLSDAAGDTIAYDQLAASFAELTKNIFGFANSLSGPVLSFLNSSPLALASAMTLMGSSLRGVLLPGLTEAAERAKSMSEELSKGSSKMAEDMMVALEGQVLRGNYGKVLEGLKAGSVEAESFNKLMISLNNSMEGQIALMQKAQDLGQEPDQKLLERYNNRLLQMSALREAYATQLLSEQQAIKSQALHAASTGQVRLAYNLAVESVRTYAKAVEVSTNAGLTNMGRMRIAVNAVGTAAKLAGTAFLYFIPLIGQAALAVSLLYAGYQKLHDLLTSEAQKEYNKTLKEFDTIVDSLTNKVKEYNRVQMAIGNAGDKQNQQLTLTGNIVAELVAKYEELNRLQQDMAKGSSGGSYTPLYNLQLTNEALKEMSTLSLGLKVLTSPFNVGWGDNNAKVLDEARNRFLEWRSGIERESVLVDFRFTDISKTNEFKTFYELYSTGLPEIIEALNAKVDVTSSLFKNMSLEEQTKAMQEAIRFANSTAGAIPAAITQVTGAFKELNATTTEFMLSSIVKSPFDSLVRDFTAATVAMLEFEAALQGTSNIGDKVAKQLSNLGPSVENFLSVDEQASISNLRALSRELSVLEAMTDRTDEDNKQLNSVRSRLEAEYASSSLNLQTLGRLQKQTLEYQKQARETAGIVRIEQARLAANKAIYEISATGLQAQYAQENKIQNLRTVAIKGQLELQTRLADNSHRRVESIEAQLRGENGLRLSTQERMNLEAQLLSAQYSYADARSSQVNLSTQLQEIEIGITNQYEIQAEMAVRRSALVNEQLQRARDLNKANAEFQKGQEKLNRILIGRPDSVAAKVQELALQGQINAEMAKASLEDENRTARAAIARQKAALATRASTDMEREAASHNIAILEQQIAANERLADIKRAQVDLETATSIAEVVSFDAKIQGVEWEQESLSILEKELDVRKQMVSEANSLSRVQREIALKSQGLAITSTQERALDIEAAIRSFDLANQEFKLKSTLINLEFSLLEAQRALLKESLVDRQRVILTARANETDSGVRAAQTEQLNALERIISNFDKDSENIASALEASISQAELQRKAAEAALRNATIPVQTVEKGSVNAIRQAAADAEALRDAQDAARRKLWEASIEKARKTAAPSTDEVVVTATRAPSLPEDPISASLKENLELINTSIGPYKEALAELGPQGALVNSMVEGAMLLTDTYNQLFDVITSGSLSSAAGFQTALQAVQATASTIGAIVQNSASAKVAAIDQEISAEERRDGKSSESIAKLQALEKKKESIERKAFETNKKIQMANAVVNTASGVASALSQGFPLGIITAGIIAAMGAAQIGIISSQQFQGSASASTVGNQASGSVSIGRRSDSIDVARSNQNAGGEYGYLRGSAGYGTNSSNFNTIGSAYGGNPLRGYGNNSIGVVGEKGPEIVTRENDLEVTPIDQLMGNTVQANIQIHAIDTAGMEEALANNRAFIIETIREAANSDGVPFLESVNTNALRGSGRAHRI